jgi:molybdopterin molybdotransferase
MPADCCTPTLGGLKTYDEALELLLEHARAPSVTETLPLRQALGRVLAKSVSSRIDVPSWDNSAMDGYALRAADAPVAGSRLPVSQRIPAGSEARPLAQGSAARIFTGAPLPPGADTVVMQEVCRADGETVEFCETVEPGRNIRHRGEDIHRGAVVVRAGTRLKAQHLGLAASVGIGEVSTYRRLKVALFATGDELVMPGQPLAPGQIYNSNLFTARALLEGLGCEVIELGIVEDTLAATKEALTNGAEQADLILASGGVSVGEEDHVKPAVEQLGSLEMWKLAIRPGKPLAFGRIGKSYFLGSPGNPVSLYVTFILFARPFILAMQGANECLPTAIRTVADFDWPSPDERREFHRARLERNPDGREVVHIYPSRSSAVLSSVAWANGLVVIPENHRVRPGDPVEFIPFSELLT